MNKIATDVQTQAPELVSTDLTTLQNLPSHVEQARSIEEALFRLTQPCTNACVIVKPKSDLMPISEAFNAMIKDSFKFKPSSDHFHDFESMITDFMLATDPYFERFPEARMTLEQWRKDLINQTRVLNTVGDGCTGLELTSSLLSSGANEFHQDPYLIAILTTLEGPGTQFVANTNVTSRGENAAQVNASNSDIHRLDSNMSLVMRGNVFSEYGAPKFEPALVHRAPPFDDPVMPYQQRLVCACYTSMPSSWKHCKSDYTELPFPMELLKLSS